MTKRSLNKLSVKEASNHAEALVLDVRTPLEYRELHVPDSVLLPLQDVTAGKVKELAGDRPVHVLCRSGNRASSAADILVSAGVENVSVLDGGILAWESEGLPVVRGQAAMSLERQVRIAAGFLVFSGAVLAWLVNPLWIVLSGFVGAGLMFAGITDTCMMGNLIARMPWNRVSVGTKASCCSAK